MEPATKPSIRKPAGKPAKLPPVKGRGRIYEVTHGQALDKDGWPAPEPVGAMLDRLLQELTGKSRAEDAWAGLFKASDVVAIKPNTLGRDACSPSPALIDALVARLRSVGVKPSNVFIWDRKHFADTTLFKHLKKTSPCRVGLQSDFGVKKKVLELPSSGKAQFDQVIMQATAVINVPVFKDHRLSGVTGALKNMAYGVIDNARDHHVEGCNPAIPEIYAMAPILGKVRLTVADVFHIIFDGGPFPRWKKDARVKASSLYATLDPVALDRFQWNLIDQLRKQKGLKQLMKRGILGNTGTPVHVLHAGKLGLGEADLSAIRHTRKTLS